MSLITRVCLTLFIALSRNRLITERTNYLIANPFEDGEGGGNAAKHRENQMKYNHTIEKHPTDTNFT